MSDSKEIIFITANTGLGFEIVKAFSSSDVSYEIILGCRTVSKGEDAIAALKTELPDTKSTFTVIQTDLSSDKSLEEAVKTIETKFGRIDALINNAGNAFDMLHAQGKMGLRELWATSWDTNVTGTQILTDMTIPLLLKSANPRLLFMTSGTASLGNTERLDNPTSKRLNGSPEKGWPKKGDSSYISYRAAKTALNMVMRHWHRVLLNDGVKVWAVSPGFLATNLLGTGAEALKKMGAQDPSVGGKFVCSVVQGARDEDVGKVILADSIQPW
ncbi:short chain dehydrogenase domain-containing protein [Sarocladium implicatum]|nr:short chain dehydrogenase domain-containing protein [Sarocladium implicatum]